MELVQPIKNRLAPMCFEERCNGVEMVSLILSTSFILKGSGWAKDGYSSKKQ
jgi:predicted nucleic acid-binding Zn ribbon protein